MEKSGNMTLFCYDETHLFCLEQGASMLSARTSFLCLCILSLLSQSAKSMEALIEQDLSALFAQEKEDALEHEKISTKTRPSKGLSIAAFWTCAALISAANITARIKRGSSPTILGEVLATTCWLGGSSGLLFFLFKNNQSINKNSKLFEQLMALSEKAPLNRFIKSYNTLALQDKKTERAFAAFKNERHNFTTARQLAHRAHAFISKQIGTVSRRLHLRRLLATCLAGLSAGQLVTGSFPCSYIGY